MKFFHAVTGAHVDACRAQVPTIVDHPGGRLRVIAGQWVVSGPMGHFAVSHAVFRRLFRALDDAGRQALQAPFPLVPLPVAS